MIHVGIPGATDLALAHLVCDVNGTLAVDGQVPETVIERLLQISERLQVHLVTADTFGTLDEIAQQLEATTTPVQIRRIAAGGEKTAYVATLGAEQVVALGNGINDVPMLARARLGIVVAGGEGLATAALLAATIVVPSAEVALDLLLHPQRLVATLRP